MPLFIGGREVAAEQQELVYVGFWQKLVESPQPEYNPNQTPTPKQLILQKAQEEEVVGLAFLLLLI
jgi:hypothetical protein